MATVIPPDPTPELDDLVAQHDAVADEIARLTEHLELIKNTIRGFGVGHHLTTTGREVLVSPPNRRFNLDLATTFLTPVQLDHCRLEGYDPKKVKELLPPVLLDKAMETGPGAYRVLIK